MLKSVFLFFTIVTGMLMPLQAAINSYLGQELRSSLLATLVSFWIGTIGLVIVCFFRGESWSSLRIMLQMPWWYLSGGLLGAIFVFWTIFIVPKIGAVNLAVFILLGQMLASVLFDHYGLLGMPIHSVNIWRIFGIFLMITGVILIRKF